MFPTTPADSSAAATGGERPRISVVVFVLNAVDTLEQALVSVLPVPGTKNVEVLVMDGGSTDGTLDIVRRHAHRIAFWRSYRDGDVAVAINEGVHRATGDVIALLPSDDWLEPGALDEVSKAFAADPELDVLSCGVRFAHFAHDGELVVDEEFTDLQTLELTIPKLLYGALTGGRFVRRRIWERAGDFNRHYKLSNDLDFLIRVCLLRPKSKVLPRLAYTYRRHAGSRTLGGDPDMVIAMMRDGAATCADHLAGSPLRGEERRALVAQHGRYSARLAWMLLMRGRWREMGKALGNALKVNRLWP